MVLELSGFAQRENRYIVGRRNEIKDFKLMLEQSAPNEPVRIVNIYGTGGVGKSTLLRLCSRLAEETGAIFHMLDSRDFMHTEESLTSALLSLLTGDDSKRAKEGGYGDTRGRCLAQISRLAGERRVILAFDTFEEMFDMEAWLRDRFIPWLPEGSIVMFAGRHPLKGAWLLSPAWREAIWQIPLKHLNREDCMNYARLCGIEEEERMEYLWKRSQGHPLTLSLAVAAQSYGEESVIAPGSDWFGDVAARWLKEVPDHELREAVEAASVLRRFNQELLAFVMEKDIPVQVFERLKSLSFVRKSVNGWQLHDLMSDITSSQFRERTPGLYKRYMERSAIFYAEALLSSTGNREMSWEVGELFRYADIKLLRALASDSADQSHYWEPVTESTLSEAIDYVEWRENCEESISGVEIDPDTGEQFRIDYSVEALRYNTAWFDVNAVFRLAPESLKLLRDKERRVHALSVIIPLHAETIPWLEQDPQCRPFFASLTPDERKRLETPRERPAGWFMRMMDFVDVMNPVPRTQGVNLIYAHMCTGGIFVCSPYPTEICRKVYPELGFRVIERATSYQYDGITAIPTYVIDTRGSKLRDFLEGLLRKAGLEWKGTAPAAQAPEEKSARKNDLMKQFTAREQDVIELVLAGCSNAEAANRLRLSEATVKKHLKSIYAKLGINTRTQLASKMMAD